MNPDAIIVKLEDIREGDLVNNLPVIITEPCVEAPEYLWYIQLDGFLWGGTVDHVIGYRGMNVTVTRSKPPTPEEKFRTAMAELGYDGAAIQDKMVGAAKHAGLLD